MPKQTISNEIGRKGERWFVSQLPDNWIFQRPTEDVGIDGNIVICENNDLNGLEFKVQIKSSGAFYPNHHYIILNGISRTAFHFWLAGFIPTLLVVYHAHDNRGYFYWVNKYVSNNTAILESGAQTITLKIPMKHIVCPGNWDVIRNDLRNYISEFTRTLSQRENTATIPRQLQINWETSM
jgi:hypothetical protein